MVMLLLAYLGAMGVFTAGAGCTMNYWNWISSSAVGDYLGAIIGSMAVVSALEMLRMVLVLCVAMARLETRRRASQAKWTRKHPEVLEVKPNIPLGTSSGTTASTRRWPGTALPQPPKVGSKTKVNPAASSASLASKADKETGGFWALPRMLRKLRRGDTRVAPERDAEQKAAKKWKFLRKVNPEEAGWFWHCPFAGRSFSRRGETSCGGTRSRTSGSNDEHGASLARGEQQISARRSCHSTESRTSMDSS
eukprot:symbB.v1.2.001627.t1/scaffold80.1/size342472/14